MRSALTLALAFAVGCAASPTDDAASTTGQDLFASVPDCTAFSLADRIKQANSTTPSYQCTVSAALSRSSQPDTRWIDSLSDPTIRQVPFRSVVNMRGEPGTNGEAPVVAAAGMTPLNIPVIDGTAASRAQVIEFLAFVTNPKNQPALVHCYAGQGRTGTMVGAYRLVVENWNPADVIAEAHAFLVDDAQIAFLQTIADTRDAADLAPFRPHH